MRHLFLTAAVVLCWGTSDFAWARTWTSSDGGFTIEAEYAGVIDGNVQLKRSDGRTIPVPVSKLTAADQAYIRGKQGGGKTSGSVRSLLSAVKQSLALPDFDSAKQSLSAAAAQAKTQSDKDEVARTKKLASSIFGFWAAVGQGADGLRSGGELKLNSLTVSVVEASQTELIIRSKGRNRKFSFVRPNTVPTPLAEVLIKRAIRNGTPNASSYARAFRSLTRPGSDAQRWEAAAMTKKQKVAFADLADLAPPDPPSSKQPAARPPTRPATRPATRPSVRIGTRPSTRPPKSTPKIKRPPLPPVKRVAVPSAAVLDKSMEQILDIFKEDITAAKTRQEKLDLAKKLFTTGGSTVKDDPTAAYALLVKASEISAKAGDVVSAMNIVNEITRLYKADEASIELKRKALSNSSKFVTTNQDATFLVEECIKLMDLAITNGQAAEVRTLGAIATTAARKMRDTELIFEITQRTKLARGLEEEMSEVSDAKAKLAKNPDDPTANLKYGQYLCFVKDDWKKGITYLAKSGDTALLELVKKDQAGTKDSKEQIALADAWWGLAENKKDGLKTGIQQRAAHWYRKALPEIKGGLSKLKIEKRIAQVEKIASKKSAPKLAPLKKVFVTDLRVTAHRGLRYSIDSAVGRPVSTGGRKFEKGISARPGYASNGYPTSAIVYTIGRGYSSLSGTIGCSNEYSSNPRSPLCFRIVGDNRVLWTSSAITRSGQSQDFKVSVSNVNNLALMVQARGRSSSYTYAVWGDPILTAKRKRK